MVGIYTRKRSPIHCRRGEGAGVKADDYRGRYRKTWPLASTNTIRVGNIKH